LSRALLVESGIPGKSGLSSDDDCAAVFVDFVLVLFIPGNFYKVVF